MCIRMGGEAIASKNVGVGGPKPKPRGGFREHGRGGLVRESKKTLLRTALFEFGIFRSEAAFPGETRTGVALSHLVVFPRTSSRIRQAGRAIQVATPVGAVFYNAGCEYSATSIGSSTEETGYLRVEPGVLRSAIGSFDRQAADRLENPFSFSDGPVSDRVFLRQISLERRAMAGLVDPLVADEEIAQLVQESIGAAYEARSLGHRETGGRADADYTNWTKELIAKTFRTTEGLAEIAAKVGVSPFHLHRVFKRVVGLTIHEFRDRMRLRAAFVEMLDSAMPLALIASRAGYSSQSHFTDAFRARFGVPPARARRLVASGRLLPTF